jgi:TIR domain
MPYDLFISYAHKDNSREQVRELRDAILEDFHKFAGRELNIFFDADEIRSMADWEDRIGLGLRESRLFLAVLSPNYFASAYCRRECEEYIRYEAMRQCLGEGVAPVYFVELPGLDGPGVEQSIAAAVDEMRKRQWCDLASQEPVKIVRWHDAG